MITILATGIAGCGDREYFEYFSRYCHGMGKKVNVIHITDLVVEEARKTNPEVDKYTMLNFPKTTRNLWYQNVFRRILSKELLRDKINIISIHVTYWWKDGLEDVVKADILNSFFHELNPLFYIQIVDTADRVKRRVDKVVRHVGRTLSLEDIYRWQDMETFIVRMLAEINQKPFYMMPQRQAADTLYRLIFTHDLKVYISFPMSFAKPSERKKVATFVQKLGKWAIVFNPEFIEEYAHYNGRLKRICEDSLIKHDFRLIEQSDIIIAYFPRVVHSPGIVTELNHANSIGKHVYVIWPIKRRSPWTAYPARKVFTSPQECLEEIKQIARQRAE